MKYDDLPAILRVRLRPGSAPGWVAGFTLAVGLLVGAVWLASEFEPYVGTDWAAVVALGVMVAVPGVVALGHMPFAHKAHPRMRRPPVPIITPSESSEDMVRALAMATGLQVERTDHGALLVQVPLRGFPLPDWIDRHGCPVDSSLQ